MKVKKIYEDVDVVDIEKELEEIYLAHKSSLSNFDDEEIKHILSLLRKRRSLINGMIKMSRKHRRLLKEFNELVKVELEKMRGKAIDVCNAVSNVIDMSKFAQSVDIKIFLGRKYPELHPFQGKLEKEMWEILTALEEYDANHSTKVTGLYHFEEGLYEPIHNENVPFCLFTGPKVHSKVNVICDVLMLFNQTLFAIPDLLWVREFSYKIEVGIGMLSSCIEEESIEKFDHNENDHE